MPSAVSTETVSMLAGMAPIKIVEDERKRVYSAIQQINPKSGKALPVRCEGRQVMLGTALWRLETRVVSSVNTQPQSVVRKRPWTNELLPNTGYVRPWSIQRLPISHEASGKPQMCQLR